MFTFFGRDWIVSVKRNLEDNLSTEVNFHSEFLPCLRAKAATPPVPSTLVAEDSTKVELLKGEAAVQTSDYRKCQGISLGLGQAADLPPESVPKLNTFCHKWLSSKRQREDFAGQKRLRRDWIAGSKCSLQWTHGQAAKTSSIKTHRWKGPSNRKEFWLIMARSCKWAESLHHSADWKWKTCHIWRATGTE